MLQALGLALQEAGSIGAGVALELLPDKGLAHDHVRLVGTGVLARIPKQSQLGLPALANLDYQRACYERAAASTHTPEIRNRLAPSHCLKRGALLVEEINGRAAVLPRDLGAIATALAAIHRLDVPAQAQRPPLLDHPDPLAALAGEIAVQAQHLGAAGLETTVLAVVQAELERLHLLCRWNSRPPRHLIAFDAHPGNFMVDSAGKAFLVDLEKCRYSYPGLDLAHASLYTSTTWDVSSRATLSTREVQRFYRAWAQHAGGALAQEAAPWHLPLRRAMWLWSITWCAKWRALSGQAGDSTAAGEDWSGDRSSKALVAHVRERVDHYLSPGAVAHVQQEFSALQQEPGL